MTGFHSVLFEYGAYSVDYGGSPEREKQMEIEKRELESVERVFTTAQLVWLDEETGDVLEIEIVGAEPWVDGLAEQGFTRTVAGEPSVRRYRCRIEIR